MKTIKKPLLIFCFALSLFLFFGNFASASGNSYYLSITGSDSNQGTSIDTSWATLEYVCPKLQAGDTLYVMEGTYTNQHCVFANSGAEGIPITIERYDENASKPVFDGVDRAKESQLCIDFNGKSYIDIDGLRIENYTKGVVSYGHAGVKNLHVSNVEVVHTAGPAIQFANFVRDSSIKNCTVEDNGWNSIAIYGTGTVEDLSNPDRYTHNITIENCTTLPPYGHSAIDLFGTAIKDIYLTNNTVVQGQVFSHQTQGLTQLMSNIYFTGNHIYGSPIKGIYVESDNSVYKDNVIYDCADSGIITTLPVNNVTFENNTIYNNDGSGLYINGSNLNFINNHVYGHSVTGIYDYRIKNGSGKLINPVGSSSSYVKIRADSSVIDVEFTNGQLFAGTGTEVPKWYPNKSSFQFSNTPWFFYTYPAYAVPTSDYLTITVNTINKDTDIWDFTVTSTVPENPTTFTLETIHPNTIYSVKRDNIEIATANTDGTGKLIYSYQVEGNEFDTTHNFKFVSTGVAVPSAHTLTITNGTGSGSYTQNQSITITANPPVAGKEFDKWTGDTTGVSDVNSSTTTVTMPSSAVSLTATYKDTTSAATPTFSPAAGTYASTQAVTITSSTSNTTIYYTVDGSTPTISSSIYSSPITVSATQTIKAIAIKSGYGNSAIGSAAYTINPISTVAAPTFSLAAGTYTSTQSVTISSLTSGATIYYTTNGNSPNTSSAQYSSPLVVPSTTTLKAIAVKTGLTNSSIASATYTITPTTTGSTGGTTGTTGGGGTTTITPTIIKVEITKTEGNIFTLSLDVQNATSMMLSESSSFLGSVWETYSLTKIYTKGLTQTKLYLKFKSSSGIISNVVELTIPATIANPSNGGTNPYPTGTLLKLSDSPKVYVIIDNKKKWIPTPEVFEQLGYKWTEIKILSQTELNTIPDYEDNLIRAINDYKVYLVVNGVKRHIPNPIIFLDYGFKWEEVKDVPQSTIDKYKPTYLIKQSNTNGIYYVNPQEIRKLIPSTEVFNSYNDKTEDIQIISKTEMDFYPLSNLIKLNGSNDIYLIEGNIKKRIPSPQVFNKYKLNWNLVMSVNQTEFNFYQDGGELK